MEIKPYSSGFNYVQPSIKGISWWFSGDSVNLSQFEFFWYNFMTHPAFSKGMPPNHKKVGFFKTMLHNFNVSLKLVL